MASGTNQGVLVPFNTLLLVGIGISETLNLARLAAEETEQRGTDLVGTTLLDGVTLLTASLEELGAFCGVTYRKRNVNKLLEIQWVGQR